VPHSLATTSSVRSIDWRCRLADPTAVSKLLHRPALALALVAMSAGCSKESRTLGPDLPQTPPAGAYDPRAAKYEGNVYQISQGGRYFKWFGCAGCHGSDAKGGLNLGDMQSAHGGDLEDVYVFIARGHPGDLGGYGDRIPAEQLWQLTAYVRSLPELTPERRRRQDLDQTGEAKGRSWSGVVK
jgi:cytochrome c oxidase cbb3-type subunit 3